MTELLTRAKIYEAMAEQARFEASQIHSVLDYLQGCLLEIKKSHTEVIWNSKAAHHSRARLNGAYTIRLNLLLQKLQSIMDELNRYAYIYSTNAQNIFQLAGNEG